MCDSSDPELLGGGRHVRLLRRGRWEYAERVRCAGVVAILAVTDDRRLVLTEQFREPARKRVIELPAGLAGDVAGEADEPLAEAARRELLEETGYQAAHVAYLTAGPPSAGLSNELVTFFHATGLQKVAKGGGVGSESIEVHEVPLDSAAAWLENAAAKGSLIDPKVYAALYFAEHPPPLRL